MTLYSPIQHLADAVFLNHDPSKRYFAIMTAHTAYFDASGDKGASMLTVGGYISTVEDWKIFEAEWNAVLDKYKVPYFHRKKFIANQKPFTNAKWKREETRKAFLDKLVGVIARNVNFCVLNLLPIPDWETVNREYCMEEERLTPFAVAGCMAIPATYEWCNAQAPRVPFNHVKFIFEDGDDDKGDFMHWSKKCFGFTPIFEPKISDRPTTNPLTPLQACDFIAGESRHAEIKVTNPETNLETFEFRRCFLELLDRTKSPDDHEKWNVENLRRLCEKHGIRKR
jgi:hypothetical protein